MNMMRTEEQAVMQEVLIVAEESADYLQDAAEFAVGGPARKVLDQLLQSRLQQVHALQQFLRDSGDLPTAADPDKGTAVKLFQRLRASISGTSPIKDILEQRIAGEEKLQRHLVELDREPLGDSAMQLLRQFERHIEHNIDELKKLLASTSGEDSP